MVAADLYFTYSLVQLYITMVAADCYSTYSLVQVKHKGRCGPLLYVLLSKTVRTRVAADRYSTYFLLQVTVQGSLWIATLRTPYYKFKQKGHCRPLLYVLLGASVCTMVAADLYSTYSLVQVKHKGRCGPLLYVLLSTTVRTRVAADRYSTYSSLQAFVQGSLPTATVRAP